MRLEFLFLYSSGKNLYELQYIREQTLAVTIYLSCIKVLEPDSHGSPFQCPQHH